MENYFKKLITTKCETAKKNNFTYTSWAEAWGELKKVHPEAVYEKHIGDNGFLFRSGTGGMVMVGVTVGKITHTADLAVTDFRNQEIQFDKIKSTDLQNITQRALAKAIAMHGIGLYVYRGEDYPEQELPAFSSKNFENIKAKKIPPKMSLIKTMYEVSKEWEEKLKNIL